MNGDKKEVERRLSGPTQTRRRNTVGLRVAHITFPLTSRLNTAPSGTSGV